MDINEELDGASFAEAFSKRFPRQEGWRIAMIRNSPFTSLPAYFRARCPGLRVESNIQVLAKWQRGAVTTRAAYDGAPWRRPGDGIAVKDWIGEFSFEWRGHPIHLAHYEARSDYRIERHLIAAYKDEPSFETLCRRVSRFGRWLNGGRKVIEVLDGSPLPRPKITWGDVVLPPGMAADIRGAVEGFRLSRARYREMGLAYRRGLLFSGPPGCGKTMAVRAAAASFRGSVFYVPLTRELKEYQLRSFFHEASAEAPSLLILEDLDRLAGGGAMNLSFLLNLLDGLETAEGVMVIATTNHPEKLDPALLERPSRFDRVFHFGLPAAAERRALLERRCLGEMTAAGIEAAVKETTGFTMAYVQEAAVSALLAAVRERRPPRDEDLMEAVEMLRRQRKANAKADGGLKPRSSIGFDGVAGEV